MCISNEDKFSLIISRYPWVAHVIHCFIEIGNVDFPEGKISICDLNIYEKLVDLLEIEAKKSKDLMCFCGMSWEEVMRTNVAQDAIQNLVLRVAVDGNDDGDGAPPQPPAT